MSEWNIRRAYLPGWAALARASIAALLALAPLMCVVFCHVVDAVHRAAPTTSLGCDPSLSQRTLAATEDTQAPLADLQQLIRAVMECAPLLVSWSAMLSVLARLVPVRGVPLFQIERQPPKPPPRLAV